MRAERLAIAAALAVAAAASALPATASADPRILSARLERSALTGQGVTVVVEARDARQPITSMQAAIGADGFAESTCRLDRKGRIRPPKGFGAGHKARLAFPWMPVAAGQQTLDVTVTAGACGTSPQQARRKLKVKVGLADLPALPKVHPKQHTATTAQVSLPLPSSTGCADTDLVPVKGAMKLVRSSMLCLLNVQRAGRRLPLLRISRPLQRAARRHVQDMARRSYFDHQRPGGPTLVDRLRKVGYWPARAGENIGAGTGSLSTPVSMVLAWMDSDGHRENILDKRYREIGLAAKRKSGGTLYVTDFGAR